LLAQLTRTLTAPDLCLVHLLKGVILRLIAHPEEHMVPDPKESPIPIKAADESALKSFL